ncbi:MAG: hypothetical protein MI864_23780 [Pseudomonadales bacterium]|nr:hypothetical protein [Pseudomonadales bacterium]
MKRENRVFFRSESEAVAAGYRACKRCMKCPSGNSRQRLDVV